MTIISLCKSNERQGKNTLCLIVLYTSLYCVFLTAGNSEIPKPMLCNKGNCADFTWHFLNSNTQEYTKHRREKCAFGPVKFC